MPKFSSSITKENSADVHRAPIKHLAALPSAQHAKQPLKIQNVQKKMNCPHCNILLYFKNFKKHLKRKHGTMVKDITAETHLSSQCVDSERGIFAVTKAFHGPPTPVHVIQKLWGSNQKSICEVDECNVNMDVAIRSGHKVFRCCHQRSLDYCSLHGTKEDEDLKEEVLTEMVSARWFGESKKHLCLQRKKEAADKGAPLAVSINIGPPKKHYVSVFENKLSYYSRLGRVMVFYDAQKNSWHCPCVRAKVSCPHKYIAKWLLFQTKKHLFRSVRSTEPLDDRTAPEVQEEENGKAESFLYPPQGKQLERVVRYILHNKKLPVELPEDLKKPTTDALTSLIPFEEFCTECHDQVPLSDPILITTKAKMVTLTSVFEGISTFCKRCYKCGMVYRYQEWCQGVHNYNDHIILDLHLCLYLRASLQTHNATSRVFEAMEMTSGVKLPPHNKLLHAYLQFEALTQHEYTYACVKCGYYPAVVIMDLHKKGVFNMPVSEIPVPVQTYNGQVNMTEFWNSVALEMVAHGFVSSTQQNPFAVHPTFSYWAPWIGPHTRKTDDVLNTEWEKVHHSAKQAERADLDVSEDRLLNEVLNLKVEDVRKLCKVSGVDSSGSKIDLVLRLREEIKSRNAYNKIFEKVWGASGGWATIMCPCGVVYSLKFNMRAESPRDYMDLLLSWKHMPNVTVYDFARGLATHGNLRYPAVLPFTPNEGRLLKPTEESIQLAKEGKIKVHLPWLKEKKKIPDDCGHPITGSADHYVLYDTLHESNTKDSKDVLRRIALVPELAGWMNSQVAEQLFAQMERNNYFLNMMTPSVQIFLIRNIVHHKNQLLNKHITEKIQKAMGNFNVTLNAFGQAVICKEDSSVSRSSSDVATQKTLSEDPVKIPVTAAHTFTGTNSWAPQDMLPVWGQPLHPHHQKMLTYVLDPIKDPNEHIAGVGTTMLTRSDFWTLGLANDLEATIANCCFRVIEHLAFQQDINVFVANCYIVATWMPPLCAEPQLSFPADIAQKDVVAFPSWMSGHWMLCILKPKEREMYFLDPIEQSAFGQYIATFRKIAKMIDDKTWTERTADSFEEIPRQKGGNNCGIYVLMYTLYIALGQKFDFTEASP
ncbi:uncharacterized protein LOC103031382 [Astyanax mexicanus]|uniref:uncharacterized protein LOC103031382 n=1 Tax=Astyanax mexicanus TaxID=7994 RepID=UPI0020CACC42|nr:uncharacterized protein LOC103031382 [Astyanax mexicanus]